jgi:hypothetical protein
MPHKKERAKAKALRCNLIDNKNEKKGIRDNGKREHVTLVEVTFNYVMNARERRGDFSARQQQHKKSSFGQTCSERAFSLRLLNLNLIDLVYVDLAYAVIDRRNAQMCYVMIVVSKSL